MKKIIFMFFLSCFLFLPGECLPAGWNIHEITGVQSNVDPAETSIVLDRNGRPHISYGRDPYVVGYAVLGSTGWWTESTGLSLLGAAPISYRQTNIGISSEGTVFSAVSYQQILVAEIKVASKPPDGTWKTTSIYSSPNGDDPSEQLPCAIAISTDGCLHVVAGVHLTDGNKSVNFSTMPVLYRSWSPSSGWGPFSWLYQYAGNSECGRKDSRLSIAIATGNPVVAMTKYPAEPPDQYWGVVFTKNPDWTKTILYTRQDGGGGDPLVGDTEKDLSVAIQKSNNAWVVSYQRLSYVDLPPPSYALEFASATIDKISVVDATGEKLGARNNIAVDSRDFPRIVYRNETNYNLKYASRTASGWKISVLHANGDCADIAIDDRDKTHVSFVDREKNMLKYARWDDVPPGRVTGISAGSSSQNPGKVQLSWTFPGDDGDLYPLISPSTFYVRYSTSPDVVWAHSDAQIVISTKGVAAGSIQNIWVENLSLEATYYFTVWTKDAAENISDASDMAGAIGNFILPSEITDLRAVSTLKAGEFVLSWTSPGDDGTTGQVAGYEIRHSTGAPFSWDDSSLWKSFRHSSGPAGTQEIETVSGLAHDLTYYFRIMAIDDIGLTSLSNIATYYLEKPPDAVITSIDAGGIKILNRTICVSEKADISVYFNTGIDSSTLSGALQLHAIKDRTGNNLLSEISGSTGYKQEIFCAVFTLHKELLKGWTYRFSVNLPLNVSDGVQNPLVFATVLEPGLPNVIIGDDEKTMVKLEGITENEKIGVIINTRPDEKTTVANPHNIATATEKVLNSGDRFTYVLPSTLREITVYDDTGHVRVDMNNQAEIIIPYRDTERDGIIDNSDPKVFARNLSACYLNEGTKTWEMSGGTVNGQETNVSVLSKRMGVYALLGSRNTDASVSFAYPVPFEPHTGQVSIKFGKPPDAPLPSECRIRIYSISGALITELHETDGDGIHTWSPVTDGVGMEIASGVYIYVIDGGVNKKHGKLAVIR